MKVIQHFMLNHILFYHFPKKLAEKSYSTFNLRISMLLASASPIKTKYFGADQLRRHVIVTAIAAKDEKLKC